MQHKELHPVEEVSKLYSSTKAHTASMIAMIDSRACIRDAIAQSLRVALDSRVIAVERIEELTRATFDIEGDSGTLVIYCDGAITDQNTVEQETRELRTAFPTAKLVLLTDRLQQISLSTFHQQIVDGIIPSSYNTEQLVACIFTVMSGVPFLPPTFHDQQPASTRVPDNKKGKLQKKLTPRQHQIMQYIVVGKSNKFIAAELSLCESTVKVHVHEVMKRLGATSRTHASYILANDASAD